MATADEIFRTADYNEPHIVINDDRSVTVPNELKYLGVQFDHNIETVVFDCPRYWDGHDLSTLDIYLSYQTINGEPGAYHCEDVKLSPDNDNIINFSWTIYQNLTSIPGRVSFIVCAQKTNEDKTVEQCWHSRLCIDCEILPGMECVHSPESGTVIPDNFDTSGVVFIRDSEEEVTASLVSYLRDRSNQVVYPITKTNAVFNNDGKNLDDILSSMKDDGVSMLRENGVATQPTLVWEMLNGGYIELRRHGDKTHGYNVSLTLTKTDGSQDTFNLGSNGGLNLATALQGAKADNAMPKSGGTFTGPVTLSGNPTSNLHAATKSYVDAVKKTADNAMPKSGGDFTGNISVSEGKHLDFLIKNGTKLRIIGGRYSDTAGIRLVDASDNTLLNIIQVDTTGKIIDGIVMSNTGGDFTGDIAVKTDDRPAVLFKNSSGKAMSSIFHNNEVGAPTVRVIPSDQTSYTENYTFPSPTAKLTESKWYRVLTSKGGDVNGNLYIADGKSITYKTVNGAGLRILGGSVNNVATIRAVDANGNTLSDIFQVDTTNGEVIGGKLAKGTDKLWENASPTSSFTSQDVDITDLMKNYVGIWIQYRYDTGDDTRYGLYIPTKTGTNGTKANVIVGVSSVASMYTRAVTVWSSKVSFGNAYQIGNSAGANTFAIPIAIYGIK